MGSPFWGVTFGSERDLWWRREGNDLTREVFTDELASAVFDVDDMLVFGKERDRLNVYVVGMGEIRSRMFDELSLSARRMVGEEQESYLEVHRMEGEVELRYALAVPVLVTTSVVTFGLGTSFWVWAAATIAGIVAGGALLMDGWRRDARKNGLIVELLAIGKAKSPTFERLLERAQQITPEAGAGAPLDEAEASSLASSTEPAEATEPSAGLAAAPASDIRVDD
jgi:hypothetical protein